VLKSKAAYIGLSVAVSAGLLWVLFSRVGARDVGAMLSNIYWPAVLVYASVALAGAWVRAWRYKRLLAPQAIGWGPIFLVTFIRNSLIDLLPARIGGLSYIYVLNKRLGLTFETATSSFVLASVLDTLTLSPFLILAGLSVGLGSGAISVPAVIAIAVVFFGIVALVLWKIVPLGRFLLAVFERLGARLRTGRRPFFKTAAEKFRLTVEEISLFRERRSLLPVFAQSLVVRLAKYVSVFSLFYALLRSRGFSLADLSFSKFILGISGAELTSALPVKGLAGFGTWESAWAVTFGLMNFDPGLAIASGIGVHLLTNVFEYSLGIGSIVMLAWPRRRHPGGLP
jgi:glycosyltransferase 2 family protein